MIVFARVSIPIRPRAKRRYAAPPNPLRAC